MEKKNLFIYFQLSKLVNVTNVIHVGPNQRIGKK